MERPNISWYLIDNGDQIQTDEYYLGSFNSSDEIRLKVQIWNNRYGTKSVESIRDAKLAIYFETLDDGAILNYCEIDVEQSGAIKPDISINKVLVSIGGLNGSANNGLDGDKNKTHFKNVEIIFKNLPSNLKEGLKNMYLDIEFD